VYFLEEIEAPAGFNKLIEDILFRLSPLGIPSLIRDSYNGRIVEENDSFVYTLSVPNQKKVEYCNLTINKNVVGNMGNRTKEFTFTVTINPEGTIDASEYEWSKNGTIQDVKIKSGDTFTMKHGDVVIMTLPINATVTVTENSEDYKAELVLGESEIENGESFILNDTYTLNVTNRRSAVLPTGIFFDDLRAISILMIAIICGIIVAKKHLEKI
jgi:hypothetical protein